MTSDSELLELAAKAQGIELKYDKLGELIDYYWNPLVYDGDALRLAVKLRISVHLAETPAGNPECGFAIHKDHGPKWNYISAVDDDPYAATRRAITRAAAEIGKRR